MHSRQGVRPIQTPADWKLPTLPNETVDASYSPALPLPS